MLAIIKNWFYKRQSTVWYKATHERIFVILFVRYQNVSWAAYEELLSVIKFITYTKSFGLKVEPKTHNNMEWNLKLFCDCDWAGDTETRISVTGFIIYFLDVPTC
jgi:hypothetical protein